MSGPALSEEETIPLNPVGSKGDATGELVDPTAEKPVNPIKKSTEEIRESSLGNEGDFVRHEEKGKHKNENGKKKKKDFSIMSSSKSTGDSAK